MSVDEAQQRFGRDTRFNAALAVGLAAAGLLLFVLIRSVLGGSPFPDGSDGEWVSQSIVVDEVVVDIDLRMSIDDRTGRYGSTCNSYGFNGNSWTSTAAFCVGSLAGFELMEIEERMHEAVRAGGKLVDSGDRLRFDHDGVTIELDRPDP